ncbi:MAG TPA: hypothetical protein VMT37_01880 [Solirubrobacterales bacterium]|nr:hypothetical protein [Solirubrobacterales bacterium]
MRRLTKLVLLGALPALLWIGVQLAVAQTVFETFNFPGAVSGEQQEAQTFSLEGGLLSVSCSHATFSGELEEPSETLTVTPAYSECKASGLSATVETHGCQYVFHGGESLGEGKFKGTADISCPSGESIEILAAANTCDAKIGSQSGLSSITYTNQGEAPQKIKITEELGSLHYTVSKDEGSCPLSGTGEKTNGTAKGNSLFEATYEAAATSLAVGDTETTRLCEEDPVKGVCPKGKSYKAGQMVKGTASAATGGISLFLTENDKVKTGVDCTGGTFSFKTKEEAANPLNIEGFSMTMTGCKTLKPTNCTVTVKTEKGSETVTATASFVNVGGAIVWAPLSFKIDCGTEIEQCEYKSKTAQYSFRVSPTNLNPGKPAVMYSNAGRVQKVGGKNGCFTALRWYGTFEITEPKALWVTG